MPRTPRLKPTRDRISGRLHLEKDGEPFLAPSRVDLLEAIGSCGSITAAAKTIGLSYKAAWDAVDAMNRSARAALVTGAAGGRSGGGTQLTAYGQRVVSLVRRIERDYADVIALLSDPADEAATLQPDHGIRAQLLLRTSARNQWLARVVDVELSGVQASVALALGDHGEDHICASVSASSVKRLKIAPGSVMYALVKATAIALRPAVRKRTSDNQVRIHVVDLHTGADQIEIGGKLQSDLLLTAIVSNSNDLRKLRRGTEMVASFAPEHVLLVQAPVGTL